MNHEQSDSQRRRAEVIRLSLEGMNRKEIARQVGFTLPWVGRIINEHRTLVVLAQLLGPEEGKRVFDKYGERAKNLLREHRWSLTREQVMEWVEQTDAFYRRHDLIMADCAGTQEH
jgi:hypothetical protein